MPCCIGICIMPPTGGSRGGIGTGGLIGCCRGAGGGGAGIVEGAGGIGGGLATLVDGGGGADCDTCVLGGGGAPVGGNGGRADTVVGG